MKGLSSAGKEQIHKAVEEIFDKIALKFIGAIPKLAHKKYLVISSKPNLGLPHLYVQAMQNRMPNAVENDALKSLLESTYGFIEGLKGKTRASVTERIDGAVKEAHARGDKVSESQINEILDEEFTKARSHFKAIAEGETTKTRNMGSLMDISRVAASKGDEDPTVFFVPVRDGKLCSECARLHLNPDGTPRVWKFSELKHSYHKRGEEQPSVFGLHPHCRCTLTYLSIGFGFDKKGFVTYIGEGHDEHAKQRAA